jgi:S1-C subfamily serine protease
MLGCAGAAEEAPPPRVKSPPPPSAKAPEPRRVDALDRGEVLAVLDEGLGSFLRRVEVEAVVQTGRFEGFRIVGLFPDAYWRGVDLRPGDVVTAVNGMPIERETEAYAAFESLRSAKELRVSLVRDGEPRELSLPIVEAPRSENGEGG